MRSLLVHMHAYNLWSSMRQVWFLPSDEVMFPFSHHWFQNLLSQISDDMVDATLLMAWRAWHASNNEVTHGESPLPCSDRGLTKEYRIFPGVHALFFFFVSR